jgi:PAS domain S-box-containing protein
LSDDEVENQSGPGASAIPVDGLLLLHKYKEDILNSLGSGLMVVDQNGLVILFNKAAGEMTGEDPGEVLFSQAASHKTLRGITQLISKSFNKPTRRQEIEIETRTGERKTIGISTYLMRHEGQAVVGVIAVFSDITHVARESVARVSSEGPKKEEEMGAGTYYKESRWEPEEYETHKRPVILIAEADASTRSFYMDVLEKAGCRVLLARDGEEIVWKTFHEVVDLIIMDSEIPETDTTEIVQRLSKTNPDLPVICTGSGERENGYVLIYQNVIAYLPKPVSIFELKRTVAGGLETAGKNREISIGTG